MYQFDPIHLIIVGSISIGYGALDYAGKRLLLKTWIRTTGTVDNVRRDRDGNTTATVKYYGRNKEKLTCHVEVADDSALGLGSELSIAYNPKSTGQAFVTSRKDMNLAAIISA